ncbi:hypothetical protein L2E82_02722 [Cichorium intybus]|uniref:Uncharacterized protein n=1 Tax=Cichorium intybus TaxID=13427 RepID=A0ACB9H3M8_CICIN|nr:hypothetical protein L2E82_02722 [Cichorium intybus]
MAMAGHGEALYESDGAREKLPIGNTDRQYPGGTPVLVTENMRVASAFIIGIGHKVVNVDSSGGVHELLELQYCFGLAASSLKKHKHEDASDDFHAAIVDSRVREEEIASPADLANNVESFNVIAAAYLLRILISINWVGVLLIFPCCIG